MWGTDPVRISSCHHRGLENTVLSLCNGLGTFMENARHTGRFVSGPSVLLHQPPGSVFRSHSAVFQGVLSPGHVGPSTSCSRLFRWFRFLAVPCGPGIVSYFYRVVLGILIPSRITDNKFSSFLTLTILSFLIHEHGISVHSFMSSLITFSNVCSFHCISLSLAWLIYMYSFYVL